MNKENKLEEHIVDSSKIKNKDIYVIPNKFQLVSMILMLFLYGGITYLLKQSIVVAVQGSLLATLLLYMSFVDLKLRLVSDYFILGIVSTALITLIPNLIVGNYAHCIYSLLAAIIIPIPLFVASFISSGGIGGGDIKLVSAVSLILGINKGLFALICGLILAVVIQLIVSKIKKIDKKTIKFALVPYLAVSAIVFYLV